ncbi:hypothetical protein [Microcoleus sp. B3-D7]|uniref:hypothetical protein n=1 Tax=Microcoleus sp. B3-D7 TaxID=2818659 RepID=UPI002FD27D38
MFGNLTGNNYEKPFLASTRFESYRFAIGSLVLGAIGSCTQPMFEDLTKVGVGAYIGLYISAAIKDCDRDKSHR